MPSAAKRLRIYFSDYFGVKPSVIQAYGAFNVSLINDLPLFIDPFLLFNSMRPEYRALHDDIIKYLQFLHAKASIEPTFSPGTLKAWFLFPEVKQTWLGFSLIGNAGSGLGIDFARALARNLHVFTNLGDERITRGSHLEKLCLIDNGVGRDNISDFTTNLIKKYLLEYTQTFATEHLQPDQRREVVVPRVEFNYETETWSPGVYQLPFVDRDYVVLTPRNLLTRDEAWINRGDLLHGFSDVVASVPDDQLRAQLNNYFTSRLPRPSKKDKEPSEKERNQAVADVIYKYPVLLDYYIRLKEDRGDDAKARSQARVDESETIFIQQVLEFVERLARISGFYGIPGTTLDETRERVHFLKSVIEHNDGYRLFYGKGGKPIHRETDLHLLFRLTWFATDADLNSEVNNGRGPVDFKISKGRRDKSLVEFKLASNKSLEKNLAHQVEIYKRANATEQAMKVIIYFTPQERDRVNTILKRLKLESDRNIVLIDARRDNKASASKATEH